MSQATLRSRLRLTSRLVETPPGEHTLTPASFHRLIIHEGAPVVSSSASEGGRTERHLQRAGDIDFIHAGCWGGWRDEVPSCVLALTICPTLFLDAGTRSGIAPKSLRLPPRLHFQDSRLAGLAWLAPRGDEARTDAGAFADAIGTAMAVRLLDHARSSETAIHPGQIRTRALDYRRLKSVLAYIDDHVDQTLSLDVLARAAGLRRSHFTVAFRHATGVSPHQFVTRRRVEIARRLLTEGGMAISEVAYQTGFAHQSHLARIMRRHTGLSPRDLVRERYNPDGGAPDLGDLSLKSLPGLSA